MLTWKQLQKFNHNTSEDTIAREPSISKKYREYRGTIKDINQHIMENMFPNSEPYCLTDNMFPYWTESNVQHDILWVNPEVVDMKLIMNKNWIDERLKELLPNKQLVVFMNLPNNQTVRMVPHYHVFYKK